MPTTGFRLIRCIGPRTCLTVLAGLVALAMAPTTARAQACAGTELVSASGGLSLGQAGGLHVGTAYTTGTAVITNTSTCDAVGEAVTMSSTVTLVPACTVVPLPGTTCSSPDSGVITITSATSTAGTCGASAITWTVSGGPGTFTLTNPGGSIPLAAGGSCTIHFNYDANVLPTVDASTSNDTPTPNLDTGGSVAATITSATDLTAGGVGTTDTKFNFACGVKVDKQVSCDGGQTWYDAGTEGESNTDAAFETANNDTAKGCIGLAGVAGAAGSAGILVRYAAQNISDSNLTLSSCTITEGNSNLGTGISTSFSISSNGTACTSGTFVSGCGNASTTSTGFSLTGEPTTPSECMAAGPGNEPDQATVNCTCNTPALGGGNPGTAVSAFDQATFGCCGVQDDKQVSCNGGAYQDVGFETNNGDGTNGCSANNGQSVAVQYFIKNTGSLPLICSGTSTVDGTTPLELLDTFVVNSNSDFTTTVNSISAGGTSGAACSTNADCTAPATCESGHCGIVNTNITQCSDTLNTNESLGNKAAVLCECAALSSAQGAVDVSALDVAQIQCSGPPNFTITKSCTPVAGSSDFTADVKVTNLGSASITCQLTDQYVSGPCGTAPTCPISAGTPVTLDPNPLTVDASSSGDSTGTISALSSTACNQACGTCATALTCSTAADCPSGTGVTAACTAGNCTYTPNNAAQAECPVGSCFTRTPGYWGTHPSVTASLLPQTVCGQLLTTTTAAIPDSATENLCENGNDAKQGKSFYTSPQQLQLIRQCTAAALNLAASGSGSIAGGESACEGFDPGIAATFNSCCVGPTSTCDSGLNGTAIGASSCIDQLGAFNALESGTFSQVGLTNGPANPSECQLATGNGSTNCSSSNLGGTINCGPKK